MHFYSNTATDFGNSATITVDPGPMACIDFTDLVVDDDIALEGDEAFTISVGNSTAWVNIIDDDGKCDYYIEASNQ